MRRILIIGIGAGDPDHLTVQAIGALNRAQVLFIPDKGDTQDDLRRVRQDICDRFITHSAFRTVEFEALRRRTDLDSYGETVAEWHGRIVDQYEGMMQRDLGDGEVGAFLVWGDPSLYDSTLRIVETIAARGTFLIDYEIIPGITSVQALAARHRVPLNDIGGPVHITTGRRIAQGFPDELDTVIVMLDGHQAFSQLDGDGYDVFWGAYLGMEDEILVAGKLLDVRDDLLRLRADARARKGWVMDTYILRKRHDP